jgi:hypothetical protein
VAASGWFVGVKELQGKWRSQWLISEKELAKMSHPILKVWLWLTLFSCAEFSQLFVPN